MIRSRGIFFTILLLAIININSRAQVIVSDSLALVDFFSATSGGNWLIPWDTTKSISEWFGVNLNEDNTRVQSIALSNNEIAGQLPASMGDLQLLTSLDLSNNQISGLIPSELGSLDTIIFLDLSSNQLSDTIPEELGGLNYLKTLDLSDNDLEGEIPVQLGGLDSLRNFNLSQNQLSGTIPNGLSGLDSLTIFNVSSNSIEGTIPQFFENFVNLRELDFSSNFLNGDLPQFWESLPDLVVLKLNDNQLRGVIPIELGALSILEELNLSENELTGYIPGEIGDLDSLRILQLAFNELDSISPSLANLVKLETLDLTENLISGGIPLFLGSLNQLKVLLLKGNAFNGPIPSQIGDLVFLEELDLSNNRLTATVPQNFVNLINLRRLDLSENFIQDLEDISILGTSGNLQLIDVSVNNLSFEDLESNIDLFSDPSNYSPQANIDDTLNIAVPIGNMQTLTVEVGGTSNLYRWLLQTEDSIIHETFEPENIDLTIDDFQENNSGIYVCEVVNPLVPGLILLRNPITLSPAINLNDSLALLSINKNTNGSNWFRKWDINNEPVFAWEGVEVQSGSVIGLDLSNNNLVGLLSDSIELLTKLEVIDLSNNFINDTIPGQISTLKNLKILDLSNNEFSGLIPINLNLLDSIEIINLSRNNLDSTVTTQFDSLEFLTQLDLSDNDLIGSIPLSITRLEALELIDFSDNKFAGEIPVEIASLNKLIRLDLSENRLTGEIPKELASLPELRELKLSRNQLIGQLPSEFAGNTVLTELFINDNEINTLPGFSNFQFNNLEIRVFNNQLTFDDFVDNFNGFNNAGSEDDFLFLPQPTITNLGSQTLASDSTVTLSIPDLHADSQYEWFKEGTSLNLNTRELKIDSASINSSGIYIGQVWTANQIFRDEFNTPDDSIVFSFAFTILVPPPVPDVTDPEPFCIGSETISLSNNNPNQQGLVTQWFDELPNSGTIPISEGDVYIHNIKNKSDTLFVTNGLLINKGFRSLPDTVVIISEPWIIESSEILIAQPSEEAVRLRFGGEEITTNYEWFKNGILQIGETGSTITLNPNSRYHLRIIRGGCSSTSSEFEPSMFVTSVDQSDFGEKILIYPNPARRTLSIDFAESPVEAIKLSINDLNGHTILKQVLYNDRNSIDVSKLVKGIYLVRIENSKNIAVKKLLIKN